MNFEFQEYCLSDQLDKAFEVSKMRFHTIGSTLFDLYKYRFSLPDFNTDKISPEIFDCNSEEISSDYMIIKKGTAYHVIYAGRGYGGYLEETLSVFPEHLAITSFTEFDLFQVYCVDETKKAFRYELLEVIQSEFSRTY